MTLISYNLLKWGDKNVSISAVKRQEPEQDIASTETHGAVDPALSSIDLAANQMEALANGTHDAITGPASRLRDRIDGVIRNTGKRRDDLLQEIQRFRQDGNSALASIGIMSEGCDRLIEVMGEMMPETVTHIAFPQRRARQG